MRYENPVFDWDAGNELKCQKHGLTLPEIEALFTMNIQIFEDIKHSTTERRLVAVGRDHSGRPVFIGFTIRQRGEVTLIRPLTARFMRAKEFLRYDQRNPRI
jgi:uncharacterized DUF497 family protein